ncbi:hypothetical protein Hanom_Chr15g01381481 [Helianthus anomalus]
MLFIPVLPSDAHTVNVDNVVDNGSSFFIEMRVLIMEVPFFIVLMSFMWVCLCFFWLVVSACWFDLAMFQNSNFGLN